VLSHEGACHKHPPERRFKKNFNSSTPSVATLIGVMGRELQKKKKRSSLPKVRQKKKSKKINVQSDPIVAANWYAQVKIYAVSLQTS
jgi:hypothetical protein